MCSDFSAYVFFCTPQINHKSSTEQGSTTTIGQKSHFPHGNQQNLSTNPTLGKKLFCKHNFVGSEAVLPIQWVHSNRQSLEIVNVVSFLSPPRDLCTVHEHSLVVLYYRSRGDLSTQHELLSLGCLLLGSPFK